MDRYPEVEKEEVGGNHFCHFELFKTFHEPLQEQQSCVAPLPIRDEKLTKLTLKPPNTTLFSFFRSYKSHLIKKSEFVCKKSNRVIGLQKREERKRERILSLQESEFKRITEILIWFRLVPETVFSRPGMTIGVSLSLSQRQICKIGTHCVLVWVEPQSKGAINHCKEI